MVTRLTADQIIKTAIAVLLAAWAALLLTGCKTDVPVVVDAPIVVDAPVDVTGVDLSKNAATTTAGDNAIVTNISFGSAGCMALMLAGLLWKHRTLHGRHRTTTTALDTAVGALDRVVRAIEIHDNGSEDITMVKRYVEVNGIVVGDRGQPDRHERCIRSRLAKMKMKKP